MPTIIALIGAILPSIALLWFFYKHDMRPEPHHVLIKTFVLGVLVVVPVVGIVLPIMWLWSSLGDPLLDGLAHAFLFAAIPEEFFKFLVVVYYCARHPSFDEQMDGIVYSVTASLGFATLENILYVMGGNWTIAVVRAFTAVPMHAFLGAILGYYVSLAHFEKRGSAYLWRGLLIVILLHGLYDFPLLAIHQMALQAERTPGETIPAGMVMMLLGLTIGLLVFIGMWTVMKVRWLNRLQHRDEAGGSVADAS